MIVKFTGSGEDISTYTIDDSEMAAGSTLGSPKGLVVIKASGAIERFHSTDVGEVAIGGVQIRYWDAATGVALEQLPGTFIIHPHCQEHVFELSNGIVVREKIFILHGQPTVENAENAVAYYHVSLENVQSRVIRFRSIAVAEMHGTASGRIRMRYDAGRRAFTAVNDGNGLARAFASSRRPLHWEATNDHGKCSRMHFPGPLCDRMSAAGPEHFALFEHEHRVAGNKSAEVTFSLIAVPNGLRALGNALEKAPNVRTGEKHTTERYHEILNRAIVMTPDADVNRGVLWAKANMLRVETLAPTGWCFVNDPGNTNNSVARDTAWFAFGSDYVTPDFSRESLLAYASHLERRGMVVEYYDIRNWNAADYGLNINDDTPLLILALWHHYNATGELKFLKRVYRAAKRAGTYILSQRNDRGLVWCAAKKTADWGICGWRNVIENYRISGATTELNSECYAALRALAGMAALMKRDKDRDVFAREADALRDAINRHLIDPETGLYYLTIDVDGTKRSDVTADLVFPVMFGVADKETAARIVSRLSVASFWTDAGIRTVPRDDIDYDPVGGYGLLGGVWVAVTFWYAFAAARFNSGFTAAALHNSFRHYSRDPRRNNTVPGQFSEWLHGETLANRGMMLSPWYPPRYLWAAIEGAAGLDLSSTEPQCNPHLSPEWLWLGVRRLRFRGSYISWFVARMPDVTMYATFRFNNTLEYAAFDRDATDELLNVTNDAVSGILLARAGHMVVLLGNTSDRTVTTSVSLRKVLPTSAARVFNSMRGEWIELSGVRGRDLYRGIPVQIDRHGFCVIELQAQQ